MLVGKIKGKSTQALVTAAAGSRSQHNFFAGISGERRGWKALKWKWRRVPGALLFLPLP